MNLKKSLENLSDIDLIREYCTKPNDILFNELYDRYEDRIYGKCIAMMKDEDLAGEALQEIFIKIYLNLSRFKEKSKFSTWVYSISYNHCIDKLRKIQRANSIELKLNIIPDIEEEVEDKELFEIKMNNLVQILDQLKPKDKAILLMKYRDDRKIAEISEALDISESAVKMRLKRAKSRTVYLSRQMSN